MVSVTATLSSCVSLANTVGMHGIPSAPCKLQGQSHVQKEGLAIARAAIQLN